MLIETTRLILRPFSLKDAEEYFFLTRDDQIARYLEGCFFPTLNEIQEAIKDSYSVCDFEKDFYLIIEEKLSHTIIGALIITYNNHLESYDTTYLIGKAYRKKGYLKEAFYAFLKEMPSNGKPLTFIVRKDNTASLNFIRNIPKIRNQKLNGEASLFYKQFILYR